jgi:hypothetical protein
MTTAPAAPKTSNADVGKSTFSFPKGDEMVAALDFFLGSGMGVNHLSYILCITLIKRMEAITIGDSLLISPIFITAQFWKDTAVIGIMLGTGAGFGSLVSILVALTKKGTISRKNTCHHLLTTSLLR